MRVASWRLRLKPVRLLGDSLDSSQRGEEEFSGAAASTLVFFVVIGLVFFTCASA